MHANADVLRGQGVAKIAAFRVVWGGRRIQSGSDQDVNHSAMGRLSSNLSLVKLTPSGNERESGTIQPLQPGWVAIAYFSEKPLSDVNVPPAQAGASARIVSTAMTALELRASFSLASIFALRM